MSGFATNELFVLLFLATVVLLWTAAGSVLANMCRRQLDVHDRIRASKTMRFAYLRALRNKLNPTVEFEED